MRILAVFGFLWILLLIPANGAAAQDNQPPYDPMYDVNGDCRVDLEDITLVSTDWGVLPPTNPAHDVNSDGRIDILDVQLIAARWGTTCAAGGDGIFIDHTSVALFDQIPDSYIEAAEALRMFFMDRSVGGNISDGLTCLSYSTHQQAPNHCRVYTHVVPAFSVDPSEVSWSRPGGYSRANWTYSYWPDGCPDWQAQLGCFFTAANQNLPGYDVLSYQYSYLEVENNSTIANLPGGFFWNNPNELDVQDLAAFEAQHPDKTIIYWTTSLARSIGTTVSQSFNDQMRQYALANDRILFDVADILSHDPNGNPCYDNRDGVYYSNGNNWENHPDDGLNLQAICQHYTSETEGGHLGSPSAGKIRVAKAFWVLMARIAGWNGLSE
jgi:hypothetical protein